MAKNKDKYYLVYTERCTPKVKSFNTETELHKFMAEFSCNMYDNPDNWIDFAFCGNIVLKSKEFRLEE